MTAPLFSSSVVALTSQTVVIEALGWALVHFVWQGGAVALALAGFLAFARRLSPQIRYTAGCVALSLMTLAAASTFVWYFATAERRPEFEAAEISSLDSSRPIAREPVAPERAIPQITVDVREVVSSPAPIMRDKPAARSAETVRASTASRIEWPEAPTLLLEGWTDRLRPHLRWLVAVWSAGVGILSLRLTYGWRTIRRLRTSANDLVDPIWSERLVCLRERLGITFPVRLLGSASTTVPMVIGCLKPAILVPAGMLTGLSPSQIEALLVHELARIGRHDYLINLWQNGLETLFFYHPAVWWVSGQIRKEREHCCDDVAAAVCGTLGYAQALASLAELRQGSPRFGLAANGAPLVERIRRLAGVNPSSQRTAGWMAITALVALCSSIALRPADRSRADGQDKPSAATQTKVSPTKVTRRVAGRVLDHEDKPIANAHIWWMLIDRDFGRPTVLAECASDSAGRFRMDVAPIDKFLRATPRKEQLFVLAPGKRVHIVGEGEKLPITEGLPAPEKASEVVIRLEPATDFVFQVDDAQGKPVNGATVENIWNGPYFPGALFGETPAEPEWPAALRERDRATTDASGQAHLTANGYQMRIAAPGFGVQTILFPDVRHPTFPIGGRARSVNKQSITLRPVGRVVGHVFADDSRSVRGIKLRINTYWEAGKAMVEGSAVVTTDNNGRFIVPAIAEGTLRFKLLEAPCDPSLIPIAGPADDPLARPLNVQANQTTRLEIRLHPPTLVEGHVQAEQTGEPVPGAEIFLGGAFQLGDKITCDDQGRYRAPFAARKVSLQAIKLPDDRHADYPQHYVGTRPGHTRTSSMHSPSLYKVIIRGMVDWQAVDIPAIVRIPTRMVDGKVIDAQGRPLVNAVVKAENGLGRYVGTTDAQAPSSFKFPRQPNSIRSTCFGRQPTARSRCARRRRLQSKSRTRSSCKFRSAMIHLRKRTSQRTRRRFLLPRQKQAS